MSMAHHTHLTGNPSSRLGHRTGPLAFSLLACAPALACAPDLPLPSRFTTTGELHDPEPETGPLFDIEPPSPADAAPPILRLRLPLDRVGPIDVDRVVLVRGQVGPAHLRQIERGALSKALSARVVPAIAWRDDAAAGGAAVVVAPTITLEPGETYAIASGDPPFAEHLTVVAEDTAPQLQRVWPPEGFAATTDAGVWCGSEPIAAFAEQAILEPAGSSGWLRSGAVEGIGARCVRFEADAPGQSVPLGPLVGPPVIQLSSGSVRLDPRPFALDDADPAPVVPVPCDPGEIAFGPGCATVLDDRLLGRSPEAPLLWAIGGAGLDHVFATSPGDPFILAPLPPLTAIALDVSTIDAQGKLARGVISATTSAPAAHVLLNEVFANPLGAEPSQEWVEIVNDGTMDADLQGFVLVDIGGETPLPPATLPPGGFALIANELFTEDGELDPAPAPGALILRVGKLGKGGLSNAGEPLKLLDAQGAVISRFPPQPVPKAGLSLARRTTTAPDGLAASFSVGPATPGASNLQ